MSRPLPRAAAPRRPAGPPSAGTKTENRGGQTLEEIRALPDFIEEGGTAAVLDPEEASAGRMTDETVIILSAKFVKQDWKKKDGTYPESSTPETQLSVEYQREGDEAGDRPYRQEYGYGPFAMFAPTKDGNSVGVRPNLIRKDDKTGEITYVPKPRKTAPALLFLKSLQDAAGKEVIEKIKNEGIKSIVGLRVHVSSRKVDGMHANAKPVLLVDFIDVETPKTPVVPPASSSPAKPAQKAAAAPVPAASAPAASPTAQAAAPAEAVSPSADISALATEALIEVLKIADGNTVVRSTIPTAIIRIDRWKNHGDRGAILKVLRDDSFIAAGTDWVLDGNNVILA